MALISDGYKLVPENLGKYGPSATGRGIALK